MKTFRLIGVAAVFMALLALVVLSERAKRREYEVNQALRQTIQELTARIDELSRRANGIDRNLAAQEPSLELLRLRGEVTVLRRQQDDLLRQLASKAAD